MQNGCLQKEGQVGHRMVNYSSPTIILIIPFYTFSGQQNRTGRPSGRPGVAWFHINWIIHNFVLAVTRRIACSRRDSVSSIAITAKVVYSSLQCCYLAHTRDTGSAFVQPCWQHVKVGVVLIGNEYLIRFAGLLYMHLRCDREWRRAGCRRDLTLLFIWLQTSQLQWKFGVVLGNWN